jgi:hypothetical protein
MPDSLGPPDPGVAHEADAGVVRHDLARTTSGVAADATSGDGLARARGWCTPGSLAQAA